jgi:PRTRC genetic system protein E
MFKELHAMAKDATLLITATAEGDQLRVSVTPIYPNGTNASAATLRPLSVIGSPEELDADFAAVLEFWKAPKRTLIEQAQAAAAGEDASEVVKGTSKPANAKPAEDAKPKSKPGRKPKTDASGAPGPAGPADDANNNGGAETFALTGAESSDDETPVAEPEPAPVAATPVDKFTIDLF